MSIKVDRIGSNLVKEISYILMTEVKNPDVRFVTVTDCKVTSDLSSPTHARANTNSIPSSVQRSIRQ